MDQTEWYPLIPREFQYLGHIWLVPEEIIQNVGLLPHISCITCYNTFLPYCQSPSEFYQNPGCETAWPWQWHQGVHWAKLFPLLQSIYSVCCTSKLDGNINPTGFNLFWHGLWNKKGKKVALIGGTPSIIRLMSWSGKSRWATRVYTIWILRNTICCV